MLVVLPALGQSLSEASATRLTAGVTALKAGRLDEAEAAFRGVLHAGEKIAAARPR